MAVYRLFAFVACLISVRAQFEVPEVLIQAINPTGVRAAIEAVPGIRLFGFHAKINDGINDKDSGSINGDVVQSKDGRFIFEDLNAHVAIGDVLHYWVFVQYENMGYRKDEQTYKVEALVAPNTQFPSLNKGAKPSATRKPAPCEQSKTTVRGLNACKGHLIFEENFTKSIINREKWVVEHRLPNEEQENEFVSYQKSGVGIDGNNLKITPTLQHNSPGFTRNSIINGVLDLTDGCTGEMQQYCKVETDSYNILPPIISGKISTKGLFSFKYGKIEIRAKLPQGNWIYPELYLEPANPKYGITGYESGVIRIAFARGNLDLSAGTTDHSNKILSGGVVMEQFDPCRSKGMAISSENTKPWGNDYHVFGLTWKDDSITLEVDKKLYGTIKPPLNGFKSFGQEPACKSIATVVNRWGMGTPMAPFDQEFYITLGLGVGGISDFPNNVTKPWKNTSPKARKSFWSDETNWYPTWMDDSKSLRVDSVKVWALN